MAQKFLEAYTVEAATEFVWHEDDVAIMRRVMKAAAAAITRARFPKLLEDSPFLARRTSDTLIDFIDTIRKEA